jgi:hypothetical protein
MKYSLKADTYITAGAASCRFLPEMRIFHNRGEFLVELSNYRLIAVVSYVDTVVTACCLCNSTNHIDNPSHPIVFI